MTVQNTSSRLEYHQHAIFDRWEEARRVFEDPASDLAAVKAAMQSVMHDLLAFELGRDPCEAMGTGWRPKLYPLDEAQAA